MSAKNYFYQNFVQAVTATNVSVNKVSTGILRPASTLSRWFKSGETGTLPQRAVMEDVARFFGVSCDDMLSKELPVSAFTVNPLPTNYKEQIAMIGRVPLYNAYDIIEIAQGKTPKARHFLSAPPVRRLNLEADMFAYDVLGNAFSPRIEHGDIVFCYKYRRDLSLRNEAVVLTCVGLGAPPQPTVLIGSINYTTVGSKELMVYGATDTVPKKVPVTDENIIGVVAVNTTEYV